MFLLNVFDVKNSVDGCNFYNKKNQKEEDILQRRHEYKSYTLNSTFLIKFETHTHAYSPQKNSVNN